jgi:hypothetical protein
MPYQVTRLVNLSFWGTYFPPYSCRAPPCCNHAFGARETVLSEVCFSVALKNNICNQCMSLYFCGDFWGHIRFRLGNISWECAEEKQSRMHHPWSVNKQYLIVKIIP